MRIVTVFAALALAGCANGYGKFYHPSTTITAEDVTSSRVGPPPKVPALQHIGKPGPEVIAEYARQGYAVIGYSSFNSGHRESDDNAIEQGEKVGADLVLIVDPKYTGSRTTTVPITTPTTSTSYTTGTATAYGSGGTVNAYGSSTTTTHGTQTNFIPMTVHRFDYGAYYLFKRHYAFGALYRDLNDAERQELQSNKGAAVMVIVDGSPAFNADILAGDIIVAVDEAPVAGWRGLQDTLKLRRGSAVQLSIVRAGKPITKTVTIEP